jgi:phosphomannomutase
MHIPQSIFRSYDIRGKYPKEINEDVMRKVGQAFAEYMKEQQDAEKLELVVANDMRDSSEPIKQAVIDGVTSRGVDVIDIGLATTPTFYFAVSYYGYGGGISITASHNPAEYNGAKLVEEEAVSIGLGSGLEQIRDKAIEGKFGSVEQQGEVKTRKNVVSDQIDFALDFAEYDQIEPYKIVVDTGNGMGVPLMKELFDRLPCEIIPMYFDLDGSFPNHEANPMVEENNQDLKEKIREENADLGIALDGDADRVFFFDETGETIKPEVVRGIMSKIILRYNPGAQICHDIRPGKITEDMIEENGGEPIVTRVGHTHIKQKAREINAPFAGESSGHYFVELPHGIYETPEIVTLMLLQEWSNSDKSIREYVQPLQNRYSHSGEINFLVDDKEAVFERLIDEYGENDIKYDFDGVTFEYNDWWFNVRKSNTTDKVRLNLEAESEEIMERKVEEVSKIFKF